VVRCQRLENDCNSNRQELEDSKASCRALEKECCLLKEENSSLRQELSKSKQDANHLVSEKEELLKELETERYKMEVLKQDIRGFSQAFSQRQGQLTSLYTKSKAIVENCKASQVALP
jgi:centromeric protein E